MRPSDASTTGVCTEAGAAGPRVWIEELRLTDFRNYASLALSAGPGPIVLTGPNGSGKTNLLEAVSLLTAGQGLRRAPYPELARMGGADWAVAAAVSTPQGRIRIGTGLQHHDGARPDQRPDQRTGQRTGRSVRIDGERQSGSGALGDLIDVLWLTPAMDGLFTGPAAERRRFLDRIAPSLDPGYRLRLGQFERAMQQRNRLLAEDVREGARFAGLERIMAETGVAIAAARAAAVAELAALIEARRAAAPESAFPWATLAIAGTLETDLATRPALDVEDTYAAQLQGARERDRAAGRTLDGPHRSDLLVGHGPKGMPAGTCSTGEQKSLLVGLVLAQAEMVRRHRNGAAPILLLDEISAHLDPIRRAALFQEIVALGNQTWMTGTDAEAFSGLEGKASFHRVDDGRIVSPGSPTTASNTAP
jgi:DNA replication and repair protein RecF